MASIETYNNKDMQSLFTLVNLPDPVNNTDASNKQYVDNSINTLLFQRDGKDAVRVVTTTNINVSSGAPITYDGVSLANGDRVGLVGQTNPAQNGIYTIQTLGTGVNGTWIRATDADSSTEVTQGMFFSVSEGTINTGSNWLLTTVNPIVLNTTALTFIKTNIGNSKAYSTTITSGASTYTITHNLNTTKTIESIKNVTTSKKVEGVEITTVDANNISLNFGVNTSVDFDITVVGV